MKVAIPISTPSNLSSYAQAKTQLLAGNLMLSRSAQYFSVFTIGIELTKRNKKLQSLRDGLEEEIKKVMPKYWEEYENELQH